MVPRCRNLVLDAGPLLSLSPLRGLADAYLTVPQVVDELKDKNAREHFEQLGLSTGVRVSIRNPDPTSLAQVIQFAKKTGDYSVLSHADICVLALTHTLQLEENALSGKQQDEIDPNDSRNKDIPSSSTAFEDDVQNIPAEPQLEPTDPSHSSSVDPYASQEEDVNDHTCATNDSLLYDDPSTDKDDGEGEWITPDNVALHKSRALKLLPSSDDYPRKQRRAVDEEPILVGCMTADFAMQNVLLQMGLTLVSTEGKRIQKVKTWVLRCHACFKICKDNSKEFCPSCGNPTLLRASVTLAAPGAAADAPAMELHLKKNFHYKLRGTKYSIPAPQPGSAKKGSGEGLILREDQVEYMRAKKHMDDKRERDERRMLKGLVDRGGDHGIVVGSWSDPDWIPGILSGSTKGRSGGRDNMPQIGYGRRNPNEKRKQ